MPKYTLAFAQDRPHDMAAAMQLAVASSPDLVREACKSPETGAYDFLRHMALRRSYVSVFAVEHEGALLIFDGHKHFITEGGFTEHTEFAEHTEFTEYIRFT